MRLENILGQQSRETPGIGKRIFIHFFARMYLTENRRSQILLCTFQPFSGNLSTVQRAYLEKGKVQDQEIPDCVRIPKDEQLDLPRGSLIHIYDGWTLEGYPKRNHCIAITNPNYEWFRRISYAEGEATTYLPLWTCEEIKKARDALEIRLDDAELLKRVGRFGQTVTHILTEEATSSRTLLPE
jgi:hypothetical protein